MLDLTPSLTPTLTSYGYIPLVRAWAQIGRMPAKVNSSRIWHFIGISVIISLKLVTEKMAKIATIQKIHTITSKYQTHFKSVTIHKIDPKKMWILKIQKIHTITCKHPTHFKYVPIHRIHKINRIHTIHIIHITSKK